MTTRLAPLILPVLLASAPLGAAELVVRDLSVGIELVPTSFSYQLKDPTGTRSGNDSFSSGYGAVLGTMWSFAGPGSTSGFLAGGEVVYDQFAYLGGGSYATYGGRLLGGYGYAMTDRWTLQAIADLGLGAGSLKLQGKSAFSSYSATGLNYSYAARLGVSFAASDSLLIDADVGYRGITSNLSAGATDLTLTSTGMCASLGLRWRFSSSPAPLE